jgi:hypothetical protein
MSYGYQTMATELKSSANPAVGDRDLLDTESCAGLTTAPDSLLAVLDTIEKSIVASRQKLLCKSPRRVGVFFH